MYKVSMLIKTKLSIRLTVGRLLETPFERAAPEVTFSVDSSKRRHKDYQTFKRFYSVPLCINMPLSWPEICSDKLRDII